MRDIKQLAGQTVIYGLGTILPRVLNYVILTILYTRIFQKEEYGIVTELYAWMVLFLIILTYGMETGFFRFSQNKEEFNKVYSTTLISLFVTSAAFLVLTNIFIEPFSKFLKYESNPEYIRIFTAILALDAVAAIPFARLRRQNKALIFSVIKILNVIITAIVVIFFLVIAPKIHASGKSLPEWLYNPDFRVGYVFLANLAGSLCTLVMLLPWILDIKPEFDRKTLRNMLGYSFPLLIAGMAGSINETIDKIMLRRMSGGEEGLYTVGEYGAGYKIGVLMALFIQMFRFAAEPFFFERAGSKNAKSTYAEVMKYFIIAMLIVFLGINLYKSGIQYIIGKEYRDALVVVPIISMAYIFYGIYINHSIWFKINNLTKFGIYITLIGACVTITINAVFIPKYGYMASAWAHVFSYLAMVMASFIFASRHYKVEYRMVNFGPYFVIAVSMVTFGRYFNYSSLLAELVINTGFILIFIAYAQFKDKLVSKIFGEKREK